MIKVTKYPSIYILILSSFLVVGCSINSDVTRQTDIYANACEKEWTHKAAPDVGAGGEASPAEQKLCDIFNDEPTTELWYQGTTGYVTQQMQAIARTTNCPLGAAVVLKRPKLDSDTIFNKNCCPPGLHFAGPNSTTIEGTPTHSGKFTTKVLLCGQCKTGNAGNWYPVVGKIKWVIKGRSPKRIE
jgi:hypothetical protein